jgi:hypothetical protein
MSVDNIGTYYTNNIAPRAIKTVIAVPAGLYQGTVGGGTAAYSGLFGAGALITSVSALSAITNSVTISVCGVTAPTATDLLTLSSFNTITGVGAQIGVTLPQDSWLQASGTGTVPQLLVSYLS